METVEVILRVKMPDKIAVRGECPAAGVTAQSWLGFWIDLEPYRVLFAHIVCQSSRFMCDFCLDAHFHKPRIVLRLGARKQPADLSAMVEVYESCGRLDGVGKREKIREVPLYIVARGLRQWLREQGESDALPDHAFFSMSLRNTPIPAVTRTIQWAGSAPLLSTRARRLGQVIRFARYIRAEDPHHEMPPTVFGSESRPRPVPYIFSSDEIQRILQAASELGKRNTFRGHTYQIALRPVRFYKPYNLQLLKFSRRPIHRSL
jgi:hypothetical protein